MPRVRGARLAQHFDQLNVGKESASSKMSRAGSPYSTPSATGPRGLLGLLAALRDKREAQNSSDKSTDSIPKNGKHLQTTRFEEAFSTLPLVDHDTTVDYNDTAMDTKDDNSMDDTALLFREKAQKMDDFYLTSDLEKKIIRQVEHYFGDYNLPKDRYMLEIMAENTGGWFDMDTMMTFKRLRNLTEDPLAVLAALEKSPHEIVQVDRSGRGRIRRNPNKPVPVLDEARKISIQERTLFIWGFDKATTSLDDLLAFFEDGFDGVRCVRQRTLPIHNDDDCQDTSSPSKREFMGSVFVTFATRHDARKMLAFAEEGKLAYVDGRKLKAKWQKDFFAERVEFNDQFLGHKIDATVHVSGFDNLNTKKGELVEFFRKFPGAMEIRKRVYRHGNSDEDWKFTGGVFVTFRGPAEAKKFIDKYEVDYLRYNGDRLGLKMQLDFFREKGRFKKAVAEHMKKRADLDE